MDRRRRAMNGNSEEFTEIIHIFHLRRMIRKLQLEIAEQQSTLIRLTGEHELAKTENEYFKFEAAIVDHRLQVQQDINKSLQMEIAALKSEFLNQQLNLSYSNETNLLATAAQAPETGYLAPANQATGDRDVYGQPVTDNGDLNLTAEQQTDGSPHLSSQGQK